MSLDEYLCYAHGIYVRQSIIPEGLRRIWITLHNANYKERIQSFFELNKRWPLYIDKMNKSAKNDAEEKIKMFRELKAMEASALDKINHNAATERRDSSNINQ